MPRLSIIIPVLGSLARCFHMGESTAADSQNASRRDAATWETTLVSVLENRPADCEIIVVLTAPYDDPYDLAGEVRFLHVPRGSGLIDSVNEAIQATNAPVVHLLAAGFEVVDGWTEAALTHFQNPRVASVAPIVVDRLERQTTIAAGLDYSRRRGRVVRSGTASQSGAAAQSAEPSPPMEVLGPLLQAAFYRRSTWELMGGLPRAVGDALADVDLALALKFAGYRSVLEPRSIVLAAAGGIAKDQSGFRQGLAEERLFWRAAPVVGWGKSLAAHPLGVLGDFVRSLPYPRALAALAGRLLGACQMRSHRAHHQWLLDVGRAAQALLRAERPIQVRIDGPHEPREGVTDGGTRMATQSAN